MVFLTLFELVNEFWIGVSSGVLGLAVLADYGIRNNQTIKTLSVVSLTAASFYVLVQCGPKNRPGKKKIVVISGCDSGLGFSLAQVVHELGFTVVAGFLRLDSPGAQSIERKFKEIKRIQLDVTKVDDVGAAVEFVERLTNDQFEFYGLINNAGVMTFGEFEWLTERLIREQIEINLVGTMRLTKAFCPLLRLSNGRVITITSHCSQATLPGLSVYGATKTALSAWSDGLRVEMSKYGVKIITFIPGSFPTESGIMSRQMSSVREMQKSFTPEQGDFYNDYFTRYNTYLSYLSPPVEPKRICCNEMYSVFKNALLDSNPSAVYKHESLRYACYHLLFKYSPYFLRDYFVERFMQMPPFRTYEKFA